MKFTYIQQVFFFTLLLCVTGVFIYMLGEYLASVLWAMVCAVVFYPWFLWLQKKFKGRDTVAALTTVFCVIMVVIIPLVLIGGLVVNESLNLYQSLSADERGSFDQTSLLDRVSQATAYLEPYGVSQAVAEERIREWAGNILQTVASSLVFFSQLTVTFIIHTVIMMYLLFFFLRDGAKLKKILMHHLPLGDAYEIRLIDRFSETTQAVVKGTLAIAVIQGLIGGILFMAVGISSPVLWGVAMGVLAIIPLVGTALIWLPAAVVLILTGSLWSGIIIIAVGALIISLIDEFLRPILVGRGSKMPDAIVLLATIGGLATFGVSGFIIGPIVAALFLALWVMFEERYHRDLVQNG